MKKCQTESCTRLVKNSYSHCYECNAKAVKEEGESNSEPEVIESTAPYKRRQYLNVFVMPCGLTFSKTK